MNKKRISIHLATKDRHSEVALCLQSLMFQTYQNWDLILIDDASGNPLTNHYATVCLINKIKLDGHKVKIIRNDFSVGICRVRNQLIENDSFNNEYTFRVDDDCVYISTYIEKLLNVITVGYDIATGVVPLIQHPEHSRQINFVKPIICLHKLDDKGNLVTRNDDLGFTYIENEILPCH